MHIIPVSYIYELPVALPDGDFIAIYFIYIGDPLMCVGGILDIVFYVEKGLSALSRFAIISLKKKNKLLYCNCILLSCWSLWSGQQIVMPWVGLCL